MRSLSFLALAALACGGAQHRAAPATPSSPPAFRLPAGVRPVAVAVDLTLTPGEKTFTGSVDIDVELAEAARTIWLHADGLEVSEARVTAGDAVLPAVARTAPSRWLALDVPRPVGPGRARLSIAYRGDVQEDLGAGVFQGQAGSDWYVFTQFEASDARKAFPCFDEPGFKVPWTLTLRVPEGQVAAANAPIEREETAGGRRVVHFRTTPPLPSYLVAFAVGPFDVVDGGVAGRGRTPLRFLVTKGRAAETQALVAATPPIFDYIEGYMGIPFPYAKLDVVAVVGSLYHASAMENAGLITMGENFVLPGQTEGAGHRRTVAVLLAHEIAHQWFGDLVTPAWWDDLWLNESFASWMETKVIKAVFPQYVADVDTSDVRLEASSRDLRSTARALHGPVENDYQLEAIDRNLYDKGEVVLAMIESWIGADAFQRGVRRHLEAHPHGSATRQDFTAALAQASDRDVKGVLGSFVEQAGIPVVEGEVVCGEGGVRARLHQRAPVPPGAAPRETLWNIPVCLRHGAGGSERTECFVLSRRDEERRLEGACPEWTAWNAGARGYYLVGGAALARTLESRSHLTRAELLAAVGDLTTLVEVGAFPIGDALKLTEPLLAADDPEALVTLLSLEDLAEEWVADDQVALHKRRVRERYGAAARARTLGPVPGEDRRSRIVRQELVASVATYAEDPHFAPEAERLARRWLADRAGLERIDRSIVLGTAAQRAGREYLETLEAAARTATPIEQSAMVYSIMSARDPAIVRAAFAWALAEPKLSPRSMLSLLHAPRGPGREAMWELLDAHLDALLARVPSEMRRDALYLSFSVCDAGERARYVRLFGERAKAMKEGAAQLKDMLANIDQCIAVRAKQEPSLRAWLNSRAH